MSTSNVRQLTDHGVPVYPITDKSLVIGLQDVPFESYVVAWDGASTPVPANIPAGVVVTYNGTDYTGTLAAGSATAPYLYLVASASQPGEYDRYIVTHTGATYAWTPLGSTTPVSPVIADDLVTNDPSKALSAKQGKILGDKTSELEAKVTDLEDEFRLSNIDVVGDGSNLQVGRILGGGIYPTYSNYRYQLFDAKKGDVVNYNGYADTGTIVFGVQNPGATTFTKIAMGAGSSATTGTYTVPADGTYGICGYKNQTIAVSITRKGRVMDLEEAVTGLDSSVLALAKQSKQFIPGESKNIFDKTMEYIAGYVNSQGKIISDENSLVAKIELKTNTEYSIGFTEAHTAWTGFFLAALDANGNNLNVSSGGTSSVYKDFGTSQKKTFQVPDSAASFFVIFTVKNASYDLRNALMLFLGGEIPTTYTPYSFQIPSGKFDTTGLVKDSDLATIESVLIDHLDEKRDDSTITNGGYVNMDGTINQNTGWSYATLQVSPGQKYTITAIAGQLARLWFFLDSNGNVLQYSEDASTIGLKTETVVIPDGCVTLEVNARKGNGDPLPSIKLHETGVDGNKVYIGTESIQEYIDRHLSAGGNVASLDFTPGATSYIISPFNDTHNIKTSFKLSRVATLNDNPCFNFVSVALVNKVTGAESPVHSCSDDIAPGNYNNTYIGANHADSDLRQVVCTGHGKSYEDIGSVWTAGGQQQYTIVAIIDENTLWMLSNNTETYPLFRFAGPVANSTFSHISGATHTDSFTITTSSVAQWHSASRVADLSVFIDGEKVTESGTYGFKKLSVCENYDVLNPASVLDLVKAGVGTFTDNPNPNSFTAADKVVRHSIVYGFKNAAEWTIATDFIAYQNINIGYFGFTQMYYLTGGNLKFYLPKSLPIDGKDFRQIEAIGSISSAYAFTSDYWENPNLPPDRWLEFDDNIGIHSGFLFDYGVGGNNRKDYVNNAITLNSTRKLYPHGIDNKVSVSAGDTFSAVVWRSYLDRAKINTGGIISTNAVEYAGKCYVYADFNAVGMYEVAVPGNFVGRDVTVFEKSSNVTMLSALSNGKVLVKVETASPMYGYLVMQIK